MQIKFYLDEDIPLSFAQAMTNRGVDVLTTQEAENKGISDIEQLKFAIGKSRVLISHNKIDFIKLHFMFLEKQYSHNGIVVSDQLPIGILLRRIMKLWFTLDSNEMQNRLEFLSQWK